MSKLDDYLQITQAAEFHTFVTDSIFLTVLGSIVTIARSHSVAVYISQPFPVTKLIDRVLIGLA